SPVFRLACIEFLLVEIALGRLTQHKDPGLCTITSGDKGTSKIHTVKGIFSHVPDVLFAVLSKPVVRHFLSRKVVPDIEKSCRSCPVSTTLVDPATVEDNPGIGAGINSYEVTRRSIRDFRQVPEAIVTVLCKI